jgi:acyl-CoA thioester hydrolase
MVDVVRVRDRVWWSDVDKMGVMFFARYIRFAEMAETEFFRALGYSYDEMREQFGIWLARVHVEIDFRHPALLDDELVCRAELDKIAGATIHFRFPVERISDGRRLADIAFVVVCLDAKSLKTTRIPPVIRDLLRAHIEPAAPSK